MPSPEFLVPHRIKSQTQPIAIIEIVAIGGVIHSFLFHVCGLLYSVITVYEYSTPLYCSISMLRSGCHRTDIAVVIAVVTLLTLVLYYEECNVRSCRILD